MLLWSFNFAAFQQPPVYLELFILKDLVSTWRRTNRLDGSSEGGQLVGTFVQREICGTDSSCLPTTVSQGHTGAAAERDAPSATAAAGVGEGGAGAAVRGVERAGAQGKVVVEEEEAKSEHERQPAAGHF